MATMLPLKGSMKTDGYVLFTLMKNNDQSRLLMEDLLVSRELLSSKHPSQYSCEYIQLAKEKPPTVDNLQYAMLIYYHEIEKNGLLAAVNALKEYSAIPVTSKNKVQIGFLIHMKQLAYFLTGDAEIEKMEKYQQLLGKMEPVSYYRGKAIIAIMEGDKQTSKENIKKVSKIISQNEKLYGFLTAEKTLTRLVKNKIGD
ncbi:hypothetical protein [Mesobacillus foraminis]|uniref:hypothetical protein n=1 Tax=Mesobacillus foraminis TaxID=279826 RepID=UPI000EF4F2F0|nr:hypothetical protein [Mesobacillus foraminis]